MKEKIKAMKNRRAEFGIQDLVYLNLMQQVIEEMAEEIEKLKTSPDGGIR